MRARWLVLVVLALGCGSTDQKRELSELAVTRLSVTAGFDAVASDTAQIFAALTYTRVGSDCPELPISAELDGVAMSVSQNGSGKQGDGCQLGFYLDAPISDRAERSTVSFRDDTGEASLAMDKLLAPHALLARVEPNSTLGPGDRLLFQWSVDRDRLTGADAYFKLGSETIQGDARMAGNDVTVPVPELGPGGWKVELGARAEAAVVSCERASECVATLAGNGALDFRIE